MDLRSEYYSDPDKLYHYRTILTKNDSLPDFNINYMRYSLSPHLSLYQTSFTLQALMALIMGLQKDKDKLDRYYLRDILDFSPRDDQKLLDNHRIKKSQYFDYRYKHFKLDESRFRNGNEIYNYSSIYMSYIPTKMMEALASKESRILIVSPTSSSFAVLEYLILVTYIYDVVTIFKDKNDSPFHDSFHILCEDRNHERAEEILAPLGKKTWGDRIYTIFERKSIDYNTHRNLALFLKPIQKISFHFLATLRLLIEEDKSSKQRSSDLWDFFDSLNGPME